MRVAAEYYPRDDGTALAPLWTAASRVERDGACARGACAGALTLVRLRAATRYSVKLWVKRGNASATRAWHGDFDSCSTGMPRLDAKPCEENAPAS